jgi:ornithine decarboxylase
MNNINIYSENEFDLESALYNRTQYEQDGFYICCLSDVIKKYDQWVEKIPRVQPFYAVKCNDDTLVLKTLAALGAGFDCATKQEITKVLSLGVSPDEIIFANTTKISHHIKFAKDVGVNTLTFDNEDELYKIKKIHPTAK